jgi:hypothetical protein
MKASSYSEDAVQFGGGWFLGDGTGTGKGRQLDVLLTITIRPGTPVRVMVTRDLILDDEGD